MTNLQDALFAGTPAIQSVIQAIDDAIWQRQPSAWELLKSLDDKLALKVRWNVVEAITLMIDNPKSTHARRSYLRALLDSEDWVNAMRGTERPGREIKSTIDALFRESKEYRKSSSFQEMIGFMANFREYAPFNNMLVRLQNPSCSFYATQNDWNGRFKRKIKDDARPMLILAPMHPVMLVYDLDSTEGEPLPKSLQEFAKFEGDWDTKSLSRTEDNAAVRDLIQIDTVLLSSTHAGYATVSRGKKEMKMRIALHQELDPPSRYGVLLHELAHIYLGHLGSDDDGWWPSRCDLGRHAMEVEAEAVSYIVSRRAGLTGSSAQYVSGHLKDDATLSTVSVDLIAKVAGRLNEMGERTLTKRRSKADKKDAKNDAKNDLFG